MLSANHALVVARLILPGGVDKGIHSFIVPLRSLDDHRLLPGVVTRDIGPKIAFNSMDNGCLELHGVREGRPVNGPARPMASNTVLSDIVLCLTAWMWGAR